MITISVGGTPLFIPEDTALVLEQNNAALSDDGITADIVWTFEIPAEPNQRILGAVQYLWSSGNRRYDCELAVDGVPISRGYLYVQSSSDERTLQCGMVANNFTVGFGEKMLRENDYGDDVVIATTEENHKSGWRTFLLESLKKHSIYKFFLFIDSQFYSDNEDYGYYKNKISPLVNDNRDDREYTFGYVNRLFWNYANWSMWHISINTPIPIEDGENSKRGCRIFNTESTGKKNGYCFAPALRLDWLVRKVLANAGLSSRGTFFQSEEIKRLYSQSMNAMDGDVYQYGVNTWLHVGGNINLFSGTISHALQFEVDSDSQQHTSFGWGTGVNIGFRLMLPVDELQRHFDDHENITGDPIYMWRYNVESSDEIYALVIGTENSSLPSIRMAIGQNEADGTPAFKYGRPMTTTEIKTQIDSDPDDVNLVHMWSVGRTTANAEYYGTWGALITHKKTVCLIHTTNCTLVQLTPSTSKECHYRGQYGGYVEGNVLQKVTNDVSDTVPQYVRLVKCKIGTMKGDVTCPWTIDNMSINHYGDFEIVYGYEFEDSTVIDTTDIPLNIFTKALKWRDHVPNLSNGEFLAKICEAFGLSMFVNPMTREIQLDFFRDVMKGASFDISQWVTGKERQEYAPKKYTISFKQTISKKEVAEKNVIEPVPDKLSLPTAVVSKNKHALVLNELVNRRSKQIKDSSKFRWEQAGGDIRLLTAGAPEASETEEVEIDMNIPNMAYGDEWSTAADKYMCQIEAKGCSPMLDEDYNGEFEMVLQQYRGSRYIENIGNIEDANPTIYDQEGDEVDNAINLSAVGKRSIGEMWLKPLYDMKGDSDRYRIVAHLPAWAFLQVMATLQPQEGSIYEQKRWILCDGIRIMPTRISSELSGRDTVICTIEGVAPHTDNSGGYPYVEVADRFLLGDQNDYVLADENDYALEIEI